MGQIVSINISAQKGERKKPAGSAQLVAGHGIEGDGHAGEWHRQVSLLAIESIEIMRAKGLDVGPGDFAENITTEGIDLVSLPVGTRLHLGSVLLEVTQIGKECHDRCEIYRQAGDCVMPREGIFAMVLTSGVIKEGETIEAREDDGNILFDDADSGRSDILRDVTAAVVTVSDKGFSGEREDGSGDMLEKLLRDAGATSVVRVIVPDERQQIAEALTRLCRKEATSLVITTGGTGLVARDVTPEATLDVLDREAPGFSEAIRRESTKITPRAMLSRSVSGICGDSLVINFPGSPKACAESFAIIRPVLGHALALLAGRGSECAR
ncbi:MAG: molybdenum cofactor biosynthesis protein [Actinobacteria bacterium]|nr:molybdenum cofactor biosynthesis protein [Actinomycetota bacterium]